MPDLRKTQITASSLLLKMSEFTKPNRRQRRVHDKIKPNRLVHKAPNGKLYDKKTHEVLKDDRYNGKFR